MPEIRILRAREHTQWDDAKGCLVPLACNRCDRCGHMHAKVFEIVVDGQPMRVGKSCLHRLIDAIPVNERRREDALKVAPKRPWSRADEAAMGFWEEELGDKQPTGIMARVGRGLRWLAGF